MKKVKYLDPKLLEKILEAPETAVEKLDLVYVNDDHLSIHREKIRKNFVTPIVVKP